MIKLVMCSFFSYIISLSSSVDYQRRGIDLPHTPAHGIIIHDSKHITKKHPYDPGPFDDLKVFPRVDQASPSGFYIPKNYEEALDELYSMLPLEYREFFLKQFGWVEKRENLYVPLEDYSFDDRFRDLSVFLVKIWLLEDKNRLLSKQVACMDWDYYVVLPSLYYGLVYRRVVIEDKGYERFNPGGGDYFYERLRGVCLNRLR